MDRPVRVRIAPSPTGDPHVGTAYIALFNLAVARKHHGKFVLRIEDTDRERARTDSESQILKSLAWLGLQWDEGPDVGGPLGPYRQSERLGIYQQHVRELVARGHAYPCFCTAERLESVRKEQRARQETSRYDRHCLGMSEAMARKRIEAGERHVVRLRVPDDDVVAFTDVLRGEVRFERGQIDDQVLMKSDGYPTYHLANVVDDHLMQISHVIRAEEWISSTPKHVLLYRAFGWQQPQWVHMPLLRNKDHSKISKRKSPTSLNYYRRAGILPGALVNFLALMGWSFGEDVEIFSFDQMIDRFAFEGIRLGGPVFDFEKLTWLNQHYIKEMTQSEFVDFVREQLFSVSALEKVYPLLRERVAKFEDFVERSAFFFAGALTYDATQFAGGRALTEISAMLVDFAERADALDGWSVDGIKHTMDQHRAELGWKPKEYFMALRQAVTGRADSPPLAESLEAVGRDMVRFRLRDCASKLLNM